MKNLTIYDPIFPAVRNGFADMYRIDPFELLDHVFDGDFFAGSTRNPAVDVREEEGRYLIEVELPGLSEKDLKLELKDGVLALATTAREEKKEENQAKKWLRRERREYSFKRSFELPEDADAERVEAKFKDGLLTVEVPKRPESAPRAVPVKVA